MVVIEDIATHNQRFLFDPSKINSPLTCFAVTNNGDYLGKHSYDYLIAKVTAERKTEGKSSLIRLWSLELDVCQRVISYDQLVTLDLCPSISLCQ